MFHSIAMGLPLRQRLQLGHQLAFGGIGVEVKSAADGPLQGMQRHADWIKSNSEVGTAAVCRCLAAEWSTSDSVKGCTLEKHGHM
jgi:hypothetical protein